MRHLGSLWNLAELRQGFKWGREARTYPEAAIAHGSFPRETGQKNLMAVDSINLSSASKHCAGVGLPRSLMLTAPYSNLGQGPCVARGAQQCQECPCSPPRRSPQRTLSFGIPAASLPECTGGKSAVCLFFINLHTHTHARGSTHRRTAACQASRKIKLEQAPKEGAASLRSLHWWPVPGRAQRTVGELQSYQTRKRREIKATPSFHEHRTRWSCKCENFLRSQHSKGKVTFSWLRPLIANAHRLLGVCLVK